SETVRVRARGRRLRPGRGRSAGRAARSRSIRRCATRDQTRGLDSCAQDRHECSNVDWMPDEQRFPWVGLLTLAGAIFVSVTSEFLPTGLLPDMARDLDVSLSTAGLLVTVFAGTV